MKTTFSSIYKAKFECKNFISSKLNDFEKKYILKESLMDFESISSLVSHFFEYIWENPNLVVEIIKNCDIEEIKESLSNFFMNNFYEAILSNNYIENSLIYILTLLIKEEINNLKNVNDFEKFMDKNSKVGYLLSELRNRSEIKNYFKTSFLSLISDLEEKSLINFSLCEKDIIELIIKNGLEKSQDIEIDIFNNIKFDKEEIEHTAGKYLSGLTLKNLKTKIYKSYENNPDMIGYLDNIIKIANDDYFYSSRNLISKFTYNNDISDQMIFIYFKKFSMIKEFMDKFITLLEKEINLFPYSIKCFCKIINILLQKKFPEINTAQRNAFISQFFFQKLIKPILADPTIELLINNFIISGYTVTNLNIMTDILGKLFSGKLFENEDITTNYTPFNRYILETMPKILEIFPKLIDVDLPTFIEDLINDKLEQNFSCDYSKLNKDEIIYHYSVCFNFKDLKAILNGLSKVNNQVDISKYKYGTDLSKTFNRLNSENTKKTLDLFEINDNDRTFLIIKKFDDDNSIRSYSVNDFNNNKNNNKNNAKGHGKNLVEMEEEIFYLIQKIKINSEYESLFNFKTDSKINFNIKEIEIFPTSKETKSKNIIIKLKNIFSDLLYKNFQLKIFYFPKKATITTQEILNSIITNLKLANNSTNDSIPLEWYCKSILNLIEDMPTEYKENDFKKLYDEMEKEINSSIEQYNFDYLSEYINKQKDMEKKKLYYEEILKNIKDLELNKKVKSIIEKDNIPVKINFNYKGGNKVFRIHKETKKSGFKGLFKKETNERPCNSIKSFINNFPDFSILEDRQNINILELEEILLVPQNLKEYFFTILKDHLIHEYKITNVNNYTQLEYKIYDYIMNKIKNKIFPEFYFEFYDEDQTLYKNAFLLSWIELKHLKKNYNKNYILEPFLPKVINKINMLQSESSPRKKFLILDEIIHLVENVVSFNEGNNKFGLDDSFPVLSYCFIKAKPIHLISNFKFMKLYFQSLIHKDQKNENHLAQLNSVVELIKNVSYENLSGITQEEFKNNCNNIFKTFKLS